MTADLFARFRGKYIDKTKSYGINDKTCRWYARCREDYIKSYKDICFTNHNGQHVAEYFVDLGRKRVIQD
jgi:hypothetical protein